METKKTPNPGTLYIIATPIGNLEDLSYRAVRLLGGVDALACEDTRHTRKLYSHYEIPSPRIFFSYHDHNETAASRKILGFLRENKSVGLCTDAGTPGVSDPGYRILSAAREQGFPVEIIPGPNAAVTALVASGLSTSSFTFKGFPPRKKGARKRFLEMEKELPHTLIFYESQFRLEALLKDALEVLGNRLAAVCFDLTKMFEEVARGYLEDLLKKFAGKKLKGEITVVIAGANPKFAKSEGDADE